MNPATVDWRLIVPSLGLVVSLVFNFLQWRWNRRPSFGEWEIDEHYRIDLSKDRLRFPHVFAQQNPTAGETGIFVKFRYRGRGTLTVIGLRYEWHGAYGRVPVIPRKLHDRESWEGLIFTRDVAMEQITTVIIEAEGGRLFQQEINRDYHERIEMHTGKHD